MADSNLELGVKFTSDSSSLLAGLNQLQAKINELAKVFEKAKEAPEKFGNTAVKTMNNVSKAISDSQKAVADGIKGAVKLAEEATKQVNAQSKSAAKVAAETAAANAKIEKEAWAENARITKERNASLKEIEQAQLRQAEAAKAYAAAEKLAAQTSQYHGRTLAETKVAMQGLDAVTKTQIQNSKMSSDTYDLLAKTMSKASGESIQYRKALVAEAMASNGSVIELKSKYAALKELERVITQTSETMKKSGASDTMIKQWAAGVDRLAGAYHFANKQMYESGGIALDASKSFVALGKETELLGKKYEGLVNSQTAFGSKAKEILNTMQYTTKGVKMAGVELDQLNKTWQKSIPEINAWEKASAAAGAASNKNGYAIMDLERQLRKGNISYADATAAINAHAKATVAAGADTSRMGQFLSGFATKISGTASALQKATGVYANFGHALKSLTAWIPAAMVIGGLTAAITEALNSVKEFDQSLKSLQAISGATDAEISILGKEMLRLSDSTKYSAAEIAKGAIFIAQAGFSAGEALQVISAAAKGAQGTLEPLTVAADLLTTVIRSFQKQAYEASSIMDMLAVAANKSKLTLEGMKTIFNYIGPVAHTAGAGIGETLAAVMALANFGVKMSTIGTGLRQIFLDLERAAGGSKKFGALIKEAGLTADDFNIKSKGLTTVLENLDKIIQGNLTVGVALFTQRAGPLATVLAKMHEHVREMEKATLQFGAAEIMAGKQTEGLSVKMAMLNNQFNNMIIKVSQGGMTDSFKGLLSILEGVVKVFTYLTDNVLAKSVVMFIALRASLAGIGAAINAIAGFTGVTTFINAAKTAYAGYAITAGAATVATTGLSGALVRLRMGFMAIFSTLNPMITFIAIMATLGVAYYELSGYQKKHSLELQETSIRYSNLADQAGVLRDQLITLSTSEKTNVNTSENYLMVLKKIQELFPQRMGDIGKLNGEFKKQADIMEEVVKEQEKLASESVDKVINDNRMIQSQSKINMGLLEAKSNFLDVGKGLAGFKEYFKGATDNTAAFAYETAKANKQINEEALQISLLTKEYQKLKLASLPGGDSDYNNKVRKKVQEIQDIKDSLVAMNDYEKKTHSSLSRLGQDWQDYYTRQTETGRRLVEGWAVQAEKIAAAAKAAYLKANPKDELGAEEAERQAYAKFLQEKIAMRSKAAEEIIKIMDKELKAKMSMIDKEGELTKSALEAEKNLKKANIKTIIGLEENAEREKERIDREYSQKELDRMEDIYAKEEALIKENYEKTKRFIEETGALDSTNNEKKIANLENEKNASDQRIALWEKEAAAYKSMIASQTSELEGFKNKAIAAEKAIAQIKKDLAKSEADLEKMRGDAMKLTMSDSEKNTFDMQQQQNILSQGYSALYQGNIADAKEYFNEAKGMITSLNAYTHGVFTGEQIDAQATKDLRLKLINEISTAYRTAAQKEEEAERAKAAAAKESAEALKNSLDSMKGALDAVMDKLGKEIVLNLNTSDAVIKLTDLMAKMGEKHTYIIDIEGRGSAQLPISQKIEALKAEFATFQEYMKGITSQFVVQFTAKTIAGEPTTLALAIDSMKPPLEAFKAYLTTLVNDFVVQFIGNDGVTRSWITEVINKVTIALTAFATICTKTVDFTIRFVGFEAIPDLINQMNALFAASNRTAVFTIITKRVEAANAGGLIRKYAEGGGVPGVGNTDTVPAMLTPGEFVVKKSVVSALGEGFFNMINGLKSHSMPSININGIAQAFAQGGKVNKQSSETFTLNLTAGSAKLPLQVVGNPSTMRQQVKAFEKELGRMRLSHA